ncbi:MAG: YwaF family protein [Bifidobacteriaceae bacterium]|nr:YwaF family protein [Bifidobacteriaceae bacterium]
MSARDWFDLLFTRQAAPDTLWIWGNSAHLVYLVIALVAAVMSVWALTKVPPDRQDRVIKWLAWSVFSIWIVPPALMCLFDTGERWIDHLPLHLCTSASILIPIGLLKRNQVLLNFSFGLSLPAAVAAIVFPGEMFQHLSSYSIHYFLHNIGHILPIVAALAPIAMGWWRPSWRYYPATVGVGVVLMGIAYPVNKLIGAMTPRGSNYFFVNWPERGTLLEVFGELFGRAMYLPVLVVVAALVMAAMFGIWSAVAALAHVGPVRQAVPAM